MKSERPKSNLVPELNRSAEFAANAPLEEVFQDYLSDNTISCNFLREYIAREKAEMLKIKKQEKKAAKREKEKKEQEAIALAEAKAKEEKLKKAEEEKKKKIEDNLKKQPLLEKLAKFKAKSRLDNRGKKNQKEIEIQEKITDISASKNTIEKLTSKIDEVTKRAAKNTAKLLQAKDELKKTIKLKQEREAHLEKIKKQLALFDQQQKEEALQQQREVEKQKKADLLVSISELMINLGANGIKTFALSKPVPTQKLKSGATTLFSYFAKHGYALDEFMSHTAGNLDGSKGEISSSTAAQFAFHVLTIMQHVMVDPNPGYELVLEHLSLIMKMLEDVTHSKFTRFQALFRSIHSEINQVKCRDIFLIRHYGDDNAPAQYDPAMFKTKLITNPRNEKSEIASANHDSTLSATLK